MDTDAQFLKVFSIFYLSVSGLLVLGIALTNIIRKKSTEWIRLLNFILILALVLGVLALPPIALSVFVALLIFLAILEIYSAIKVKDATNYDTRFKILSIIASVPIPFLMGWKVQYLPMYLIACVLVTFFIPVFTQNYYKAFDKIGRAIACYIFSSMLSYLVLIRQFENGVTLCTYVIFATALSDSAAYALGGAIGKHKLVPALSPKKTIEGSIASLACLLIVTMAWFYLLYLPYSLGVALILAVIVGVFAQIGDLVLSVFKRDVHIKDYGNLIPGHGGILDRFDSLVVATPVFFYALKFLY